MKRKLIEPTGLQTLVCDNVNCDFKLDYENLTITQMSSFIGVKCPECGEILLTNEDMNQYISMMKAVDFINKWFSWILIFKKKKPIEDYQMVSIHCHDGIKIKNESKNNTP